MGIFNVFWLTLVFQETTLTGWHLVGDSGRRVWSVHRQTLPYLSVRHSEVVSDLGSAYYWNAPGLYLGNKVRCKHTHIYAHMGQCKLCIHSKTEMVTFVFSRFKEKYSSFCSHRLLFRVCDVKLNPPDVSPVRADPAETFTSLPACCC